MYILVETGGRAVVRSALAVSPMRPTADAVMGAFVQKGPLSQPDATTECIGVECTLAATDGYVLCVGLRLELSITASGASCAHPSWSVGGDMIRALGGTRLQLQALFEGVVRLYTEKNVLIILDLCIPCVLPPLEEILLTDDVVVHRSGRCRDLLGDDSPYPHLALAGILAAIRHAFAKHGMPMLDLKDFGCGFRRDSSCPVVIQQVFLTWARAARDERILRILDSVVGKPHGTASQFTNCAYECRHLQIPYF